jgi:tetratricopeptide (TPR) repeat protein
MTRNRSRHALQALSALSLIPAILACCLSSPAEAQIVPRITIERPAERPVRLNAAAVEVQVAGSIAVTTIELTMHNPNARILEGALEFPLRDGQSVIGFASEVNGVLRDAVAIEKAKGRQVFDDVVRGQIDPALLEKTAGNNYKLRVYPIRPNGNTRVRIRLMETLATHDDGLRFRLPLGFASGLERLDLAIRVADPGAAPGLAAHGLGVVALRPSGRYYETRVERHQIGREAEVSLLIPEVAKPRVTTQTTGDARHFHAELPVQIQGGARPLPKRLAVVWDASGSGMNRRRDDELALLRRYLERLGDVEVSLHVLRDVAEPARRFTIRGGDSAALRAEIARLAYDGATSLAALPVDTKADAMLLFSDGIDNFGDGRLVVPKMPVFPINSAQQSDVLRLRHLAARSGGTAIDLSGGYSAEALEGLFKQVPAVIDIDAVGLADVSVAPLGAGDTRLRVAGRITGSRPELKLRLAGSATPTLRIDPAAFADAAPSPYAARLWAQLKVDELMAERATRRNEILRIAKAHALVTEETSLIVLERIEDYVRHEIEPPAEPASLRTEYEAMRTAAQAQRTAEVGRQTEKLAAAWSARKAWWSRVFPKDLPKPPEPKIAKQGAARVGGALMRQESMREESDRADVASAERRSRDDLAPMRAMAAPAAPAVAALAPAPAPVATLADKPGGAGNGTAGAPAPQVGVRVKKWSSDAPWVRRLAEADPSKLYATYLDERSANADSPAFFVEAADLLAERKHPALALRVLSNLAEMQLENRDLLRVLANRLVQSGHPKLAVPILRRVLDIAPDEPHSLRDLALALTEAGQPQEAADLLIRLVNRDWAGRFGDIDEIALAELNALAARHPKLDLRKLDPRLAGNLPVELRIVLQWDTDNTDVDLWVTDPNGEKVYFGHRESVQGGRISRDVTGSYGPEEFILKSPKPGKYRIHANFYGHRQQVVTSGTIVEARITTGFGTSHEKTERALLRLKDRQETALVAEIEVK